MTEAQKARCWGTRMNSGKELAGDNASRQKQLPAPDAFPKLAATAGDLRDNAQVAALLQSIAKEISQSDQRHGTALADLRSRLSLMSERRTGPADPVVAAESPPEPSQDERIPFGHKKPALAIEDHRNAPVEVPLAIVSNPDEPVKATAESVKATPALSAPRMAAAKQAAISFDHIYASVAETYAEATRAKGLRAQDTAAVSRPAPQRSPEPDFDDDAGDFLDMSALATPHLPPPRAKRPAAVAEPIRVEAPPAAPPRAAVEASLAMQKSISDLAGRISETENKIALAARHPDDAKALTALSAQIESLRTELEKLVTEHEGVSVKVGHVSANVTALAEAAGRIGPMSDSIGLLNEAILTLRKELPSIAETTATRTSSKVAETLASQSGHAELSDKLAIVQNLLLSQARDHQETDGRSFGALQSIRGLVENLHNRIDALEAADPVELAPEPLPPVPARVMVSPVIAKPALGMHVEPQFEDGDTGLLRTATLDQPHAAAPAMSREDLIASARRAAAAMAPQQTANVSDRLRAQTADLRALATPKPANSPFAKLGSRRIVTVAMVALLAAALGMVFTKVMRKPAPVVTVEQTTLPDIPDDLPDAMPAKKPQTGMAPATANKDASKPAAPPAHPADDAMPKAVPQKNSALEPDDMSTPAANAAGLPMASDAVVNDVGTPVQAELASLSTAPEPEDLPATIAPLSLRTAALAGDPVASYTIADRILAGKGVARDPSKAARWYEQSAKAGQPLAEFKLGVLYERGDEGVTADRSRALGWYQKGAEHGNVQAMHNLAVLFTAQAGGEPDYAQAAKWFEQAANYGLKDSQYNLAVLYENGLGVTKSVMTAYKWLAIDAAHGDAEAAKRRDTLRKQVPVAMLSTVEAQAKSWHAKQPDLKANTIDALAANTVTVPALDGDVTASAAKEVGAVQQMLSKLGYDPGTLDGTLTAQTRDAIRTFEGRSGLQPTGEISPGLVRKLKSLAG